MLLLNFNKINIILIKKHPFNILKLLIKSYFLLNKYKIYFKKL